MKVTFVANFMNHHQLPFSLEMDKLTQGNYTFVAVEALPDERKNMGYANMNDYPFIIKAYESEELYKEGLKKIETDDMVIFGSCPDEFIDLREKTGKPFIIYSERFLKKGTYRRFIPITYNKIYNRMLKFEKAKPGIIASSAYLPYDLKLLKSNFNIYKWGYFPEVKRYQNIENVLNGKEKATLLWVARFIKLKHPEHAIYVADRLKKAGYDFTLKMIGVGPLEEKIKRQIRKKGLEENVILLGAMSTEEVRLNMEKSEVFLFTSDFNEGWGAVLNEAMNSGCACVSSHAIGSVPFLVREDVNGFIYRSGNKKMLFNKVKKLLDNREIIRKAGENAYHTIADVWCPENATKRLYELIGNILEGDYTSEYTDGPCSKANVIYPKYMEEQNDNK